MNDVLFFVPHQDDEVLIYGASQEKHKQAGYSVSNLLCTTGINSGVQKQTNLSRPGFSAARNDEYEAACIALGVTIGYSPFTTPDGMLGIREAEDIIVHALEVFPNAYVKVPTYMLWDVNQQHPDHRNLGTAAYNLKQRGVVTDVRYYIEPWGVSQFKSKYPTNNVMTETANIQAAIDAYRNSPTQIGIRSVPSFFDLVERDQKSYYHV